MFKAAVANEVYSQRYRKNGSRRNQHCTDVIDKPLGGGAAVVGECHSNFDVAGIGRDRKVLLAKEKHGLEIALRGCDGSNAQRGNEGPRRVQKPHGDTRSVSVRSDAAEVCRHPKSGRARRAEARRIAADVNFLAQLGPAALVAQEIASTSG